MVFTGWTFVLYKTTVTFLLVISPGFIQVHCHKRLWLKSSLERFFQNLIQHLAVHIFRNVLSSWEQEGMIKETNT